MVKYNKLIYFLYLIGLHSVCIFFSISCFWFPDWGAWFKHTRFLNSSFPVYPMMIILVFPALSIAPYVFRYNFPYVPISKKLILTGLLITNETLILAYTAFIHKIMA